MDIKCPACDETFHVLQPYQYHAGFSNEGFLYCDSCPNLLVFDSYDPNYSELVPTKHPWSLTEEERSTVEDHLVGCPCGGRFKFNAAPKCPVCLAPVAGILRDSMHYIETGRRLDSRRDQIWVK